MNRRSLLLLAGGLAVTPRLAAALPSPPALRRLNLVNAHTGESFAGPYRNDDGPIAGALDELSYFLRDFRSSERIGIDVGVLDFLASMIDAVGATRATILSAYRTPATNEMLRHTMFGVAEHSQHLYGRALDVYLPARLEEAMQAARTMRRGGVGWYPRSGFVHIDTGPVREWTLDGTGFGNLLLFGKPSQFFREPIEVSAEGEFVRRKTGRPVTAADRLAIHRLLDRAVGLSSGR
jgi:uncharacterized protein YcbK (DUF882 family)